MITCKPEEYRLIAPLFQGKEDTLIASCLQGHMGQAWADRLPHPQSARICTGDFCFLAGEANRELLGHFPNRMRGRTVIFAEPAPDWRQMIETFFAGDCSRGIRYAFYRDSSGFNLQQLRQWAMELPDGYRLCRMTEELGKRALSLPWAEDFCANFASAADFARRGIGFPALRWGELCAGASSYAVYDGGIEIEVDTRADHRRKGLARACAAALIVECLEKGLYPNWDAANETSRRLALSLGYRFRREYEIDMAYLGEERDGA